MQIFTLIEKLRYEHYCNIHNKLTAFMLSKLCKGKIYFPCLEIPITTYCSLCCKDCSNLMQYYEKPYHISNDILLSSIKAISQTIDGIDCLRILGGEPLLAPGLTDVLRFCTSNNKIKNIVIVTNGTLLFSNGP